MKRDYIYSQ